MRSINENVNIFIAGIAEKKPTKFTDFLETFSHGKATMEAGKTCFLYLKWTFYCHRRDATSASLANVQRM